MRCSRCGWEVAPGELFCDGCGALLQSGQEEQPRQSGPASAAGPSVVTETAPSSRVGSAPLNAGATAAPRPVAAKRAAGGIPEALPARRTPAAAGEAAWKRALRLPLWAWVLTACATAAFLLTGLAWPGWFRGGNGKPTGPAQVVDSYFKAMQDRDGRALLGLFLQSDLEQAIRAQGLRDLGQLEEEMGEILRERFPAGDLRISGLEYETSEEGDEATVRVVRGKAAYTGDSGEKVEENVGSGMNVFGQTEFRLKRVDGRWFIKLVS